MIAVYCVLVADVRERFGFGIEEREIAQIVQGLEGFHCRDA